MSAFFCLFAENCGRKKTASWAVFGGGWRLGGGFGFVMAETSRGDQQLGAVGHEASDQGSDGVVIEAGDARLDDGIKLGLNEADGLAGDFDGGRQGSVGQLHVCG